MSETLSAMKEALKTAMKEKDELTRDVLRMTLNAVKQYEVDNRITAEESNVVDLLTKEVKKRRDTIEELRGANRLETVDRELEELAIVERFLPEQLSREELEALVKAAIATSGATSAKEMGKVMAVLMPSVKGRADGKLVNEVVRGLLGN